MVKLLQLNTLEIAASWLTQETGDSGITPEYLLDLCIVGEIETLAAIPGWITNGKGEIDWRNVDQATGELCHVDIISGDGLIRITPQMAVRLQNHGKVSLDCARIPVIDVTSTGMKQSPDSLYGTHDGRMLEMSHLRVRRSALETYAKNISKKPVVAEFASSTPTQIDANNKEKSWQEFARKIADELNEVDAKAGAYDSVKHISERVAVEMRKRRIHGPRGPLTEGTVLREALQGGRWKR